MSSPCQSSTSISCTEITQPLHKLQLTLPSDDRDSVIPPPRTSLSPEREDPNHEQVQALAMREETTAEAIMDDRLAREPRHELLATTGEVLLLSMDVSAPRCEELCQDRDCVDPSCACGPGQSGCSEAANVLDTNEIPKLAVWASNVQKVKTSMRWKTLKRMMYSVITPMTASQGHSHLSRTTELRVRPRALLGIDCVILFSFVDPRESSRLSPLVYQARRKLSCGDYTSWVCWNQRANMQRKTIDQS